MSKAIKFKNNTYLDTSGVVHNKVNLKDILNNIVTGSAGNKYTPAQMASMTSGNTSSVIDITKTHLFYTDWTDYASYDNRFPGTLGIYVKSPGSTSTGGVAVIFFLCWGNWCKCKNR